MLRKNSRIVLVITMMIIMLVLCVGCIGTSETSETSADISSFSDSSESLSTDIGDNNGLEYIDGKKVMSLFWTDMNHVFDTLNLNGEKVVTEKVYVPKAGIERDVQFYTSNQTVQFCDMDFQIAFYFNPDTSSGENHMTYVNYYRDYTDIEVLYADAQKVFHGLADLYGESSEMTGSRRFSLIENAEGLQKSLKQGDVIEHWDLPDLKEDEMIVLISGEGLGEMNPDVLKNYHCRLYIETESHGEGYRLYITYRAMIYG